MPVLLKFFKELKREHSQTLIPKPNKDTTGETYRLVSMMKIGTKILSKILKTKFSSTLKDLCTMIR